MRSGLTTLLSLFGFACLSTGVWMGFGTAAGIAAVGASALAIEALGERDDR
jgi:hypothetical protein